jgi:universal stress protein E
VESACAELTLAVSTRSSANPKSNPDMAVNSPKSILVVVERTGDVSRLMSKVLVLARALGAQLELFQCDSEQAYVLGHAYAREGVRAARAAAVAEARRYLAGLRDLAVTEGVETAIDAECDSPLYETVVRKVLRGAPDLVVKSIAAADPGQHRLSDPNDWQLMRTCPAMLMLAGHRAWRAAPRIAAAIDVSEGESELLSHSVIEAAAALAQGLRAELHVAYGESGSGAPAAARSQKLRRLCDEAGIAPDRTHVLSGQPERTLPPFLRQQGYDALVLGALAHRTAGTTPVGTLTSTLLDALDCDFVLVKPPSYRSPIDTAAP